MLLTKLDEPSTVQIVSSGCNQITSGSGFVVAPGLVLTDAHVVSGDPAPMINSGSVSYRASTVLFDPNLDLAILRVPALNLPVLKLRGATVGSSTAATVIGYANGGPLTAEHATVLSQVVARLPDIYGTAMTSREIYEVNAIVRPGDSGGPLVAADGRVLGVVFATSTTSARLGFVLTSEEVLDRIRAMTQNAAPVYDGGCNLAERFVMKFSRPSA